MRRYGIPNDPDEGDVVANCMNAAKTSAVGTGHSSLRSTKLKKRLRTQMNKVRRATLKVELLKTLKDIS